jgi:hypothetical protein
MPAEEMFSGELPALEDFPDDWPEENPEAEICAEGCGTILRGRHEKWCPLSTLHDP